jgi:hypothetical protein
MNDGKAITDAYQADPFIFTGGGGHMIFIDLYKTKPDGSAWKEQELKKICTIWSGLIRSASLAATCYNIGENSVMLNVERAWMTKDIMKFVARQVGYLIWLIFDLVDGFVTCALFCLCLLRN